MATGCSVRRWRALPMVHNVRRATTTYPCQMRLARAGIVLQQTGNTTMREVSEISKQPHPHQRPPLTVLEGVKRRNTENGQIECTNSISMRNIDGKQKNSGMRSIIFPDMTKQMKHTECQ
mmetsp:Transcript_9976/g.24693  ORF Transcript_9976/g.24693 Transcript_9976/m.24693 type:complete len:120 (-) Transcript_9976:615-974(-)